MFIPRHARSLAHGYAAAIIYTMCFFSTSLSMPAGGQESDCLISNIFVAQDMGNEVRVTHKNSLPESIQQSIPLPNEHLPSVCGTSFSHCNMILVDNSVLSHAAVLVVPVQRGVALISVLYDIVNGTVQLESYHILELTSAQVGETMCQITTLYDFSDATTRDVPGVIGLCLNSVEIRRISITINFNNLSRSALSQFTYDMPITLHPPGKLSNFVSITNNLPLCWEGILSTLTYYFEQSNFGLFDVTSQEDYPEEYTVYYTNDQKYMCSAPRQLVHVSKQNLVMYCENLTAEIDMCEFSGTSIRNVKFYNESNGGVPYYCSSDMSTYVMVSGKTVTFNSTINRTIPLMSNESIYFGDCFTSGDRKLFALTTTIGNIYLLDLQQEDGVLLKVSSQPVFAQHQVFNESILYANGSSTVLYNTSCQSDPHRVVIDHPYHLAVLSLGEGTRSCSCSQQVVHESTTEPGPGNELPGWQIFIFVLIVTVVIVIVVVVVIFVKVLISCGRCTVRGRTRQYSPKDMSGTDQEMVASTSFTSCTSPKGGLEGKGQRSSEVETGGARGGEGGQEKAEEVAVTEDISTRPICSVPSNQSGSAAIDRSLAQPQSCDSSGTSCDQREQVQSGSGTGTCCQENSWKNSEKKSVVLTSPQQNPYPGIAVSQPDSEARTTNERTVSDENLTRHPCYSNDESDGTRTSSSFNSSLGNSGSHPPPTTNPVECSDST